MNTMKPKKTADVYGYILVILGASLWPKLAAAGGVVKAIVSVVVVVATVVVLGPVVGGIMLGMGGVVDATDGCLITSWAWGCDSAGNPLPDPTPINGGWGGWSTCSAACGPGVQSRVCDSPAVSNGGAACVGPDSQACTIVPCPVNGACGASAPVVNEASLTLCTAGDPGPVTRTTDGTFLFTWICAGLYGGAPSPGCSAPRIATGSCQTPPHSDTNSVTRVKTNPPFAPFCSDGVVADYSDTGSTYGKPDWTWNCNGVNNGSQQALCKAFCSFSCHPELHCQSELSWRVKNDCGKAVDCLYPSGGTRAGCNLNYREVVPGL